MDEISKVDPQISAILKKEIKRQEESIILIASENYTSPAVLEAQGCVFTNKYAEGYPGKRFYQGCNNYDDVENIAIQRAKKLFSAEHVNVQPHSGSQANMEVFYSFLDCGDRVLSMRLDHGGHLTHGLKHNFSGRYYKFSFYGVDKDTEMINYDEVEKIALKFKPKMIICGASSYPRIIDFKKFRKIADKVNAFLMADIAHIAGLIAAGVHPNPFPYCDVVTTTTHKTLRGGRGAIIMCKKKYADSIDKAVFPGIQGGPLMHEIAAKAVAFEEASKLSFKKYQQSVVKNCKLISDILIKDGLRVVSNGTDNHLLLVDVSSVGLNGKQAAQILEKANIVVNKNVIPFDKFPASITSGIRVGTPSVTTRGMGQKEVRVIAESIIAMLKNPNNKATEIRVCKTIKSLCKKFPIYCKR